MMTHATSNGYDVHESLPLNLEKDRAKEEEEEGEGKDEEDEEDEEDEDKNEDKEEDKNEDNIENGKNEEDNIENGKNEEEDNDDDKAKENKAEDLDTIAELGKVPRLLRVDEVYSQKHRQTRYVKTAKVAPKLDRISKRALVVRRIIGDDGTVLRTEVDVKSHILKDLLLDIFEGVKGLKLNETPPQASPIVLFHALPHLIQKKDEENGKPNPNRAIIDDIDVAIRFVEEDFGGLIASRTSLLANRELTWDLLWTFFPPKCVVIATQHGPMHQMLGLNFITSSYRTQPDGNKCFAIGGSIITHDGGDFGWGRLELEMERFEGTRPIDSLPFYPLEYSNERETVTKQLVARGRQYFAFIGKPRCLQYAPERAAAGDDVMKAVCFGINEKEEKFNARGRVMLDVEAYATYNSSSKLNKPTVYSRDVISNHSLTEDQLLICAYWINGFSFSAKTWGQFMVESLTEVVWNEEAFQKLVMKEKRRNIIHQLVKAHRQGQESFDDIVPNKGRGLVCLFAGPPGVGKTTTAELVAETTQRPLYVLSAGELGIEADVVDKRLSIVLDITRRWCCVLLIDEADVFLAKRGKDLVTDSLVSVFLRRLEYFQGILILTTNRESVIDPAFESRVHIKITYPALDEESRAAIWRNFIDKAAEAADQSAISGSDLLRLARRDLNGRQIKNAVACATSLAREQKMPLTAEGIETFLDLVMLRD